VHELGIAATIAETVERELSKSRRQRPRRAGLRIGVLAGVDAEALQFAFEALIRDTALDGMTLEIESRPLSCRCSNCGDSFVVCDFVFDCPRCGTTSTDCVGGRELEIAYLEVEDEPATARA
jgi:hydrogenase nickel incorporation protein HypA/HybF